MINIPKCSPLFHFYFINVKFYKSNTYNHKYLVVFFLKELDN